jgi:cyclase
MQHFFRAILLFSFLVASQVIAQELPDKDIEIIELTGNIHVLRGIGGNIAVYSGDDGVFIVDDDMPPLAGKVDAAIRSIRDEPVRMVFNTHWHFDHTGGNEHFGNQGSLIVAHDNVYERMSTTQFSSFFGTESPPSPKAALPVVTFDQGISFHLNGGTIRALHIANAHTDGDAVLFFEEANIVHTGDLFSNRQYPFIDISSGGSARGMLKAADELIAMLNDATVIIPGHGPVANLADMQKFREMLFTVIHRIQLLIDDDKSLDEILTLSPTLNYDDVWAWDFLPPERFTKVVYDSLIQEALEKSTEKSAN